MGHVGTLPQFNGTFYPKLGRHGIKKSFLYNHRTYKACMYFSIYTAEKICVDSMGKFS